MEKQPTNAQTWLKMDLEMQSGAIWCNEWKDRFFKRKKRQNKHRKKKP